eukprot:Skav206292  [mRNA]  locus=scaffold6408:5377:8973:+ [translate_table: standard]
MTNQPPSTTNGVVKHHQPPAVIGLVFAICWLSCCDVAGTGEESWARPEVKAKYLWLNIQRVDGVMSHELLLTERQVSLLDELTTSVNSRSDGLEKNLCGEPVAPRFGRFGGGFDHVVPSGIVLVAWKIISFNR